MRRTGMTFALSMLVASLIATTGTIEIADARQPKTAKECLDKYNACGRRCAGRTKDYPACIKRTCDPQHDRCIANLPDGDGKRSDTRPDSGGVLAPTSPKPKIGRGPFSPMTPGILNTNPGMPAQGPAAAGSPMPTAAPAAAPPVIIR